ncbi:MAG: LemA family protein [Bacteroidetes bacterium CG18_big_fil_WC_8_21_14_2_50_41_14]|nr:MAG: LemA family protein [Bacteroidetes bacterium CG18_big_fil_WC_8_21_14_2_50_41_14]PJB56689.1 MAG: LemA family protein [Bacteroidetes bacterium CG_4_9_14_3_um_filter_41_19]
MKKGWIILIVILGAILMFIFMGYSWYKSTYNSMVSQSEVVDAQWAQVENVYQRRADLIPNLVEVVKGYASHEKETLEGVINARAKATSVNIEANNLSPQSFANFQQAQEGLTQALSKLMVVVERYPDLKANQNFLELQAQLEGTENRITVERQKFNNVTKEFNTTIKLFPNNLFAGMFGFSPKPYFAAQQGAETAPKVSF